LGTVNHQAFQTTAIKILPRVLVVAALAALGAVGFHKTHRISLLREQNERLQRYQTFLTGQIQRVQLDRDEATNQAAAANAELARLKSGQNPAKLLKLRGEVGVLRQQLALVKAEVASPSGPYPRMMKDPAMKEFMRQQTMNFLKWNFGSVFKELKLTPDQTEKAAQLISDLALNNVNKIYVVPQGTLSPAEIAQAEAEHWTEFNAQLQPILGEKGCARFKQVWEEIPAHAAVDLLNGQLGASQLSGDQGDKLFQVIKAEPFELTRGIEGDRDPAFWASQEYIDDHLLKVAESNQRVLQQASSFLSPDQLAVLSTVLSNGISQRITQAAALIPKP
jgi:hypothetical protein